jgi:hypothetical protein
MPIRGRMVLTGLLNARVLEVFRASEVWRLDLVGSVVDELGLNGSGAEALAGESSFSSFCARAR